MTPTLFGRLQTRLFALALAGGLWTLLITPLLPAMGGTSDRYKATFSVLAVVMVVGLGWEFVYHFLQQFRWEKDWPTMFGLLTGVNEGVLTWLIISGGWAPVHVDVPGNAFVLHFATTWLVTFLFVNGPIRVLLLRWRFRGGRII